MFCVLDKILRKVSWGHVYCLIFGSVLVRVVDYLEFVSELLLLNARCAIFLLYQGVKLYNSYISMIWQCYSIYSRPTLFNGFYSASTQNSLSVNMSLISDTLSSFRANHWRNSTFLMILIFQLWTFHIFISTVQHQLHREYTLISQMIRYYRVCGSYHDFINRGLLLPRKLLDHFESFTVTTMAWLIGMEYLGHE